MQIPDVKRDLGRGFKPHLDHAVCRSCNPEVRVMVLWASFHHKRCSITLNSTPHHTRGNYFTSKNCNKLCSHAITCEMQTRVHLFIIVVTAPVSTKQHVTHETITRVQKNCIKRCNHAVSYELQERVQPQLSGLTNKAYAVYYFLRCDFERLLVPIDFSIVKYGLLWIKIKWDMNKCCFDLSKKNNRNINFVQKRNSARENIKR